MLIQPTIDTLNRLKLHGMALALSEQMTHTPRRGSRSRNDLRCCSNAKNSIAIIDA